MTKEKIRGKGFDYLLSQAVNLNNNGLWVRPPTQNY